MYADYKYYKSIYFGDIITDPQKFEVYSAKAQRYINYITHGRVATITNDVKNAVCAVAEKEFEYAEKYKNNNGLKSESVDGWSQTFAEQSESSEKMLEKAKYEASLQCLGHTGLMYRGV